MAFTIHIACNDYRNGSPQGYADAVKLESISLIGGRVTHAELGPVKRWQTLRGAGEWTPLRRVRIGRIVMPYFSSQEWYGNWCWNGYSVMKVDALRALNYLLMRPDWHVEEAPSDIFERCESRRPITPIEWRDMQVSE